LEIGAGDANLNVSYECQRRGHESPIYGYRFAEDVKGVGIIEGEGRGSIKQRNRLNVEKTASPKKVEWLRRTKLILGLRPGQNMNGLAREYEGVYDKS
jgi:hypothetical protein